MSAAHTPGPWVANYKLLANVEAGNGAVIAKVQRLGSLTTMQANQRLIAAAPQLLAACQTMDAHYSGSLDHQPAYVKLARAALAKATGEAS